MAPEITTPGPGQIHALLVSAGNPVLSVPGTADLEAALEDFIPPYYPTEIDLQNMVAVLECTSKSLLPKQYRDLERAELIRRTNELLAASRRMSES